MAGEDRSPFRMISSSNAKILSSKVTKADARTLCKFWNGHGSMDFYYTYQSSVENPRFFDVMKNPIITQADRDKFWSLPWSGLEEKLG